MCQEVAERFRVYDDNQYTTIGRYRVDLIAYTRAMNKRGGVSSVNRCENAIAMLRRLVRMVFTEDELNNGNIGGMKGYCVPLCPQKLNSIAEAAHERYRCLAAMTASTKCPSLPKVVVTELNVCIRTFRSNAKRTTRSTELRWPSEGFNMYNHLNHTQTASAFSSPVPLVESPSNSSQPSPGSAMPPLVHASPALVQPGLVLVAHERPQPEPLQPSVTEPQTLHAPNLGARVFRDTTNDQLATRP